MSRNNKRKWDGECEGETSEGETSEGPQRKEHKSRDRGRDLEHRRHRSPPPQRPLIPFERVTSEGETSEEPQRKEHKSRDRGRDLDRRRHRSPPPQRPLVPFERVRTRTSFDNIIKTFDYEYHGPPDILRLLTKLKPFLKKKLENKFKENGPHKFFFAIHSTFNGSSGDEFTHIFRRYKKKYTSKILLLLCYSGTRQYLSPEDFEENWGSATRQILRNFDEFLSKYYIHQYPLTIVLF